MTPQEEMRLLVESDGGCWHERMAGEYKCLKCETFLGFGYTRNSNPSPSDLQWLMDYAERRGYFAIEFDKMENGWYCIISKSNYNHKYVMKAETPADALRSALVAALKGE